MKTMTIELPLKTRRELSLAAEALRTGVIVGVECFARWQNKRWQNKRRRVSEKGVGL